VTFTNHAVYEFAFSVSWPASVNISSNSKEKIRSTDMTRWLLGTAEDVHFLLVLDWELFKVSGQLYTSAVFTPWKWPSASLSSKLIVELTELHCHIRSNSDWMLCGVKLMYVCVCARSSFMRHLLVMPLGVEKTLVRLVWNQTHFPKTSVVQRLAQWKYKKMAACLITTFASNLKESTECPT
jgi:hypothetical protein